MKVTVTENVERTKEIELDLPIYRAHHVGSDHHSAVIYMKVDKNDKGGLSQYAVNISEDSVEIEIIENYSFDGSGLDYLLGQGAYKSNSEKYLEAVEKAKMMLHKL